MKKLAVLAFVLAATAAPAVAQTRGVTADDYLSFESLADPHFSPDGSTIAYVRSRSDGSWPVTVMSRNTISSRESSPAEKYSASPSVHHSGRPACRIRG